jgi:hypothetical protein
MKKISSPAPIIAAVLLILPVLYVGSYLALVVPSGRPYRVVLILDGPQRPTPIYTTGIGHYRFGVGLCQQFYWPLEQLDRKVRPRAWESPYDAADFQNYSL